MGALNGTISYTLYHVDGELESSQKTDLLARIHEFRFQPLTPEAEEDQAFGWCRIGRLLETEEFRSGDVFMNDYLCLGVRFDRWSLPSALFKARLEEAIEDHKREFNRPKLNRSQKEAVRDVVTRKMKEQLLPSAAMTDMVWNLDTGVVRFWTQAGRTNEMFQELFESTFQVRLVPTNAYVEALNCGLEDAQVGRLAEVEHTEYVYIR